MSGLSYGDTPSQGRNLRKMHPSEGASQFKASLILPCSVQSCELLEQGQYYPPLGNTSSREVSQFKTPLHTLRSNILASKLRSLDRSYLSSGVPPFNEAQLFPVINPLQSVVQQSEKRVEQDGYHPLSGIHLSNGALQHTRPTMSLPGGLALPSISARDTYTTFNLRIGKSRIFSVYPNISTNLQDSFHPLVAQRQRRFSQGLRELEQSKQPALSRSEARARPKALRRMKVQVTMKLILTSGTVGLVGGMASFQLLSFPTYLVVIWAVLLIIFSNLVSWELCSYYQLTSEILDMEAINLSTISPSDSAENGCCPTLKDISATTGYSHRRGLEGIIGLAQGRLGYHQIPFFSSLAEKSGRKRVRKSCKVPMPHEPRQGVAAHWNPAQVRACTWFFKALSSVVKNGHPAQTLPSEKECKV